jgi:hypothetical protein
MDNNDAFWDLVFDTNAVMFWVNSTTCIYLDTVTNH